VPYSTSNAEFLNALPQKFKQNVLGVCGEEVGGEWLNAIPRLIHALEEKWRITIGQYFPNISYNFVAAAEHENGSRLVIKLGPLANDGEADGERTYLGHLNGNGAVRLIKADPRGTLCFWNGRCLATTFERYSNLSRILQLMSQSNCSPY
jgi:hypothetical protein